MSEFSRQLKLLAKELDVPVVAISSGSTGGTTIASVTAVSAGSFVITLTNLHASTAETGTLLINYVINKAAI